MAEEFRYGDPNIREGDLVVTHIAGSYMLGRVLGDGTRQYLGSQMDRGEVLRKACAELQAGQRVFIVPNIDSNEHFLVDCAKVPPRGEVF